MPKDPIRINKFIFIVGAFFIALMVEIIPLPHWGEYLRPQLVLLVLIYWQLTNPDKVNLLLVLFLGLLLDILHHTVLGTHALALIIISYFLLKFHRRIKMFALGRQMLTILGLFLSYEMMLLLLVWLTNQSMVLVLPSSTLVQYCWLYFSNAIINTLIWPCFAAVLYNLQKCFFYEF